MKALDKEEKEIIESYENEEWVSSGDELIEEIKQVAKNSSLKKIKELIFASRKRISKISRLKQWKRAFPIRHLFRVSFINTIKGN
jgi:hypothetical protein